MTNVLFLCTGNSCRSQMAEGWMHQLAPNRHRAQSAGIEAHGKNPRAIAVMQEKGIDISQQESTQLTDKMLTEADLLITVCGHADEYCPTVPERTGKAHWPLEDPARASGREDQIMATFRASRDEIQQRVEALLKQLDEVTQ